jgi:mRNA interferase MazF
LFELKSFESSASSRQADRPTSVVGNCQITVVINFPFSDLSQSKRRPAIVLATLKGDDLILCQITSQARDDDYSVRLETPHFETGSLNRSSCIRPNWLFTADSGIVLYRVGHIRPPKLEETVAQLIRILKA